MIPDNELSLRPLQSKFIFPDGIIFGKPTQDYELGGIALQDPSKGLEYQPWYGYWEPSDSTVYLQPNMDGPKIAIFTEPNVFEFSFTFDQNMRYCAGTLLTNGNFNLRWYDTAAAAYVITPFAGIEGFKLALDDKRQPIVASGASDIIFTYISDQKLYFRAQRERFLIQHLLTDNLPKNLMIANFGMNERFRMQWRLRYRKPGEILPWLQ